MCRERERLDCVGLLGHFVMRNGQLTDVSHNGWQATHAGNTEALSAEGQLRLPGSGPTYRLDGVNDYVTLAPRTFGGPFTFAGWIKRDTAAHYARVFNFGKVHGAQSSNDGVWLFSHMSTEDLSVRVMLGAVSRNVRLPRVL